jgi:hypothetical protein
MAQTGGAAGAGTGAAAGTSAGGTAAGTAGTGTAGTTGAGTAGTASTGTAGTTGAGAGTTSGSTASGGGQGPGSNANLPDECRNLAGRALGDCLKLHGGAMGRGASGDNHSLTGDRMKAHSGTSDNDTTTRGNGGGTAPTGDMGGASGATK